MTEPSGLLLLLIRPSIPQIFENQPDSPLINADVIMTNYGMYTAKGINKHLVERLPMLCISESCHVGYTIPMILDLRLCLGQLAEAFNPPIDYPLGLFTNRDVIVITEGLYTVQLFHYNAQKALEALEHGSDEFHASKIVYAATLTDEVGMTNLRRLEATAKHLLPPIAPEPTTFPKLPPEIISDWQHDFLEPLFKHIKEGIAKNEQPK